jgi:hypothetical protein
MAREDRQGLADCSYDLKGRVSIDEQGSILGVWHEALAIIRQHPSATIIPAAVLGALARSKSKGDQLLSA